MYSEVVMNLNTPSFGEALAELKARELKQISIIIIRTYAQEIRSVLKEFQYLGLIII